MDRRRCQCLRPGNRYRRRISHHSALVQGQRGAEVINRAAPMVPWLPVKVLLARGVSEGVVDPLAAAEQAITFFHVRYRD